MARLIKADVQDIVREDGAVTGVRAGGETIACDAAVIATGVWSGPLAKKAGPERAAGMRTRLSHRAYGNRPSCRNRPVMVASGKFVLTPMEGRLRLAGIVEFGGLEAPPSRAPFELLKRNVRAALPGMTWTEDNRMDGPPPRAVGFASR